MRRRKGKGVTFRNKGSAPQVLEKKGKKKVPKPNKREKEKLLVLNKG